MLKKKYKEIGEKISLRFIYLFPQKKITIYHKFHTDEISYNNI